MLTACSPSSKDLDTQKSNEKQSETESVIVESEENTSESTQESKDAEAENDKPDSGKIAVVYFSGTGNTKVIAEMIAKETNADIFEIVPEQSYTDADLNYNDDNCRANKEQNDDASRPKISNDLSATTEYDVIYLGHPIWWGTVPRIIQTYLEKYDLSDATIHTFCTSGSSSIDKSLSDLKGWYPKLKIIDGKRLNGATESDIKDFCSR
ncbi:MAG: flavodoxin [Lachnospiraceae bacterium]|nr:flavodoxin [Lachnospiraceae bacterium]